MKRRVVCWLVVCLCLFPMVGLGAIQTIYSVRQDATEAALLDNSTATYWVWESGVHNLITPTLGYDICLMVNNDTVGEIWLRSGNYSSQESYFSYSRPAKVTVRLVSQPSAASVSYVFQLMDRYDPTGTAVNWQEGYQCLVLPQAVEQVSAIYLTLSEWYPGSLYPQQVCISDLRLSSGSTSVFTGLDTTLTMRLATRSGPSTNYDGLGSYHQAGTPVRVLSLAYDDNDVPWVQVEFTYQRSLRRAYTGLKRVNAQASQIPEESTTGTSARLTRAVTPRYGPGTAYASHKNSLAAGTAGQIFQRENGYALFEFFDAEQDCLRRVWVPLNDMRET